MICHPCITTANPSYRFPIFETSATALCGSSWYIHISFEKRVCLLLARHRCLLTYIHLSTHPQTYLLTYVTTCMHAYIHPYHCMTWHHTWPRFGRCRISPGSGGCGARFRSSRETGSADPVGDAERTLRWYGTVHGTTISSHYLEPLYQIMSK